MHDRCRRRAPAPARRFHRLPPTQGVV